MRIRSATRRYGFLTVIASAKSVFSRWVSSFPLPWLEVREHYAVRGTGPQVRSHLFTHAGLSYLYQYSLQSPQWTARSIVKELGCAEFLPRANYSVNGFRISSSSNLRPSCRSSL